MSHRLVTRLPHNGSPKADCGNIGFRGHRADDGEWHGQAYRKSCRRKECPLCRPSPPGESTPMSPATWEQREALAVVARVETGLALCNGVLRVDGKGSDRRMVPSNGTPRHGRFRSPIHCAISPQSEWAIEKLQTKEGYVEMRRWAYAEAKAHGICGGALVFHPLRSRSSRWDYNCATFDESQRDHWYVSPHFHFVGCGWLHQLPPKEGVDGLEVRTESGLRHLIWDNDLFQAANDYPDLWLTTDPESGLPWGMTDQAKSVMTRPPPLLTPARRAWDRKQRTGWASHLTTCTAVIRNIGVRSREDLLRTVHYLLTHAGIPFYCTQETVEAH